MISFRRAVPQNENDILQKGGENESSTKFYILSIFVHPSKFSVFFSASQKESNVVFEILKFRN